MRPFITLRPPRQKGSRWILEGDIHVGGDTITLQAKVGRRIAAWLRDNAEQAIGWLGNRYSQARRMLGSYVDLEGDWQSLAPSSSYALDALSRLASHPRLDGDNGDVIRAVELVSDLDTPHGEAIVRRILAHASTDRLAADALDLLHAALAAQAALCSPRGYWILARAEQLAQLGNPSAARLVQAARAFGREVEPRITVSYDLATIVGSGEDHVGALGDYTANRLVLRGITRQMDPCEASRHLAALARHDPYSGPMPRYSGPDEPMGSRYGYGGYPDDTGVSDPWGGRPSAAGMPDTLNRFGR